MTQRTLAPGKLGGSRVDIRRPYSERTRLRFWRRPIAQGGPMGVCAVAQDEPFFGMFRRQNVPLYPVHEGRTCSDDSAHREDCAR
jgi:hypothetical protein